MQCEVDMPSAVMPQGNERRRLWILLAGKSPAELRARASQEISKRQDLVLYLLGFRFGFRRQRRQKVSAGTFFFSPDELPAISLLLSEKLPEEAQAIVEQAERICCHRFDLLGYEGLDYGSQIDWHLDVVHGKRAPLKPWFKVRYLDFAEVGDHKIIGELNRHQHLVTLSKAYRLTREARFAAEAVHQWYDWRQKNPYPMGINWASSLEVAFRSLSWLWMWHLLVGSKDMSPAFQRDLLQGLEICGRHIERYLSTYFSPNTHLLGEGVALFFIGTLCPILSAAERWKRRGWEIVLRESERQVQPDGMHFEQSAYYHLYATDFFLHSRILAACNDVPIPAAFDRTIEKMLEVLNLLAQAGPVPRLGDDDGGRVFNPCRNRAEHMTDPLSTGAVLFNSPDFKAAAGNLREETLWLLGPEAAARFEQLQPCKRTGASARLESSGICVMTSSGRRQEQLVIDAGPLGYGNAGHGHADALSGELTLNRKQWLVDPGTFCYIAAGKERDQFRGTAAHNTLQVDGLDQAEPWGPFAWRSLPRVSVASWVAGKTFNFFGGKHNGYCRLPQPVIHKRRVFHLKEKFWLVQDRAEGEGAHKLALHWHVGAGANLITPDSENIFQNSRDGQRLAIMPVKGHGWQQAIIPAEVSAAYGVSEPILALRYSATASLPAEFATLIIPLEQAASEKSQLGSLMLLQQESKDEAVSAYLYERAGEKHNIFFAGTARPWTVGSWASDAQFLYCGVSAIDGWHLILCGGSFVKWNGKSILACNVRMERWELLVGESGKEEFCSDEAVRQEVNVNALLGLEASRAEVVSQKGAG